MTREQQIDIVAIAIRAAWLIRENRPKPREWDDVPDKVREEFRREARAAINAYEATTGASRIACI